MEMEQRTMKKTRVGGDHVKTKNIRVGVDPKEKIPEVNSVICEDTDSGGSFEIDRGELTTMVFEIPEILETILNHFDKPELLSFRAVSKSWNEEVCRILMKNAEPIQEGYDIESWNERNDFPVTNFKKLNTLLASSINPGILLKEVGVFADQPEFPSVQNLFPEFGKYVKHLRVKEGVNLIVLNKYLVREDDSYCPNVDVLEYHTSLLEKHQSSSPPPVFKDVFKLNELRFRTSRHVGTCHVALVGSILKNSPQLTRLHFGSGSSETVQGFFKLLQTVPHITSNLNTLFIQGSAFPSLKELFKSKFGKLRSFQFQQSYNPTPGFAEFDGEDRCYLIEFLKSVKDSIEIFEVKETYPISFNFTSPFCKLPVLPHLKVFTMKDLELDSKDAMELLKKAPALRKLNVANVVSGIVEDDGLFGNIIEDGYTQGFVHKTLEQIYCEDIKVLKISSPTKIRQLNQMFPKMLDLKISMTMKDLLPEESGVYDQQKVRVYFEEYFQVISEMKHLKELYIDIEDVGSSVYKNVDLTQAFRYLKNCPCLEEMYFDQDGLVYEFPKESWLMELIDAPKLRKLDFYGCMMGSEREHKEKEARLQHRTEIRPLEPYDLSSVRLQRMKWDYRWEVMGQIGSEEMIAVFAAENIALRVLHMQ